MTEEMLKKMDEYLRSELMKSAKYADNNERTAQYRIEHSYRVAYIAKEIATKENLDSEMAFVAGLFHDIGYSIDYLNWEDNKNHGRYGAKIIRPFLLSLGYSKEQVEEMCYGIAIHVDDKADFEHETTKLALTIGDADNIDRFDAYRLYEGLHFKNYMNLPIEEQCKLVNTTLERLERIKTMKCGTETAQKMFQEKIDYQIEFYNRLNDQIKHSK